MSLKLAILSTPWGQHLHSVAHARGIKTTLHTPYTKPTPASTVFARVPQRSPDAGRAWALAHIRAGGKSVQSVADLELYENRGRQMDLLADYFPRGEKVRTMEWADEACQSLGFPIVSKASFGSASHTVRALHNKAEAMAEAAKVLGAGISFPGLGTQHSECLWQEFLPGNSYSLRVAKITDRLGWAFKVMNRPNDWRASGSGICVPLTPEEWESPRIRYAVNTASAAANVMGSRWCAFDLLWDTKHEHGRWRIVDVTLAWNLTKNLLGANYDAPIYDLHRYKPEYKPGVGYTGRRGRDQWDVLLDDLLAQAA